MTSINDIRKTTRIQVNDNEWIEIWEDLTVGDVLESNSQNGDNEILGGFNIIRSMIKDWSFEEELNDENIKKLPQSILMKIQENTDFGKKK